MPIYTVNTRSLNNLFWNYPICNIIFNSTIRLSLGMEFMNSLTGSKNCYIITISFSSSNIHNSSISTPIPPITFFKLPRLQLETIFWFRLFNTIIKTEIVITPNMKILCLGCSKGIHHIDHRLLQTFEYCASLELATNDSVAGFIFFLKFWGCQPT